MAFPPPTIPTNVTDATDQAVLHPQLHNQLAAGVNDLTGEAQRVAGQVTNLAAEIDNVESNLNTVAGDLNTLEGIVNSQGTSVNYLLSTVQGVGIMRGRTNIDAVTDGGSVRYTQNLGGPGGITDTGDGSGFTAPAGVYGVAASTIPDGGSDLTCYINIGARSVAVGSRLEGDGATYATWVGYVAAGEQITVRVRMPAPRAVVGGRLEIWRLAEST